VKKKWDDNRSIGITGLCFVLLTAS
jgi:hypothetical protein